MQKYTLLLALSTVVLAGCGTQGSVTGDSIPRQLAEDLASGQIYLDIPLGFPEFTMPEGVAIQGALDRGFNTTLILISELPEAEVTESLRAALLAAGWTTLESPQFQPRGGFVGAIGAFQPPGAFSSNQLCHDDYGNLSLNPRGQQGIYRRISLDWNYNNSDPRMTCAQQNEQRQGRFVGFNPMAGLNEHMPVLELPPEDRGSRFRPPFGGGTSGSGDAFTARTPLVINWDMARINRWFSDQLEDQDWEHDVSWNGEESAGSAWRKDAGDEGELAGLLDIVHAEGNNYQLRFRLSYKDR